MRILVFCLPVLLLRTTSKLDCLDQFATDMPREFHFDL